MGKKKKFLKRLGEALSGDKRKGGSKKMKDTIVLVLVSPDGKKSEPFEAETQVPEYADAMTQVYEHTLDEQARLVLHIPVERYRARKIVKSGPKPMMCGFDSVVNYLKGIHGIWLSNEDEKWYEKHPLLQKDGLPMADTLRVTQELIDPYGLRIARVQLQPGTSLPTGLAKWIEWLGVNPLGLADRSTSNAEFCEQTGLDPIEAAKEYRIEFTEKALRPAVVYQAFGGGDDKNVITGSTGGHASYGPPRRIVVNPVMSLQISRVENDPWTRGVPTFDPMASLVDEELYEPDFYDMWMAVPSEQRDKLKKPFSGHDFNVRPLAKKLYSGPTVYGPSGTGGTRGNSMVPISPDSWRMKAMAPGICRACGGPKGQSTLGGQYFCLHCWTSLFFGLFCPNDTCNKMEFTTAIPRFKGWDRNKKFIYFTCGTCQREYYLDCTPGKATTLERIAISALEYGYVFKHEQEDFVAARDKILDQLDLLETTGTPAPVTSEALPKTKRGSSGESNTPDRSSTGTSH